jgi:PAS domain S-box-containing protein
MDSISILHVDDEPDLTELTATFLERERETFDVSTAASAAEGLDRLAEEDIDCIVSDYDMPGMNGLEFLEAVREDRPDLPFVLFTGKGSEEIASEAISVGVTEYLNKGMGTDQYTVLANRIANAVSHYRAERHSTEQARVIEVIRGVTQAVVRATTRAGIERAVCDRLAEADPYRFAWIGEPDRGARASGPSAGMGARETRPEAEVETIVPRAHSGVEDGYLDDSTVTTGGRITAEGPAGEALRTGAVQVVQDTLADPAFEPWHEPAAERGYRSVAAIPLSYEQETYGVLAVYADRPDAFDGTERAVLSELGETVGHAIHAAGTRDRLQGQYRELFERAPVMYATTRNRGGEPIVEDCNERFCATLDHRRGTVIDRPLADFYTTASTADLFDGGGYKRALDGEFVSEERQLLTRDGTTVETLMRAVPRMDEEGDVIGTLVLFIDVTERRRAEEVLGQARAMEASMDGMAILDSEGQYVYANDAHAEIYGYDDPDAFLGESWRLCYDEGEVAVLDEEGLSALDRDGRWRGEAIGCRRDGSRFPQELSLTAIPSGEMICVVRDITERKRRERDLERYEAAIETVDDAVYVLDDEGRFEFVNEAFTELTGYDAESVLGDGVGCIKDDRTIERFEALIGNMLSADVAERTVEFEIRTADGEAIPCEDHLGPRLVDGEFRGVVGVIRDITERTEREETLRELTTAMDASIEGVAVTDAEGYYTYVNEAHASVYGYDSPEAFLGEHWRMCYSEGELAAFEERAIAVVKETGQWRGEATGKRRDGTEFPQEVTLTALENGGLVCVVRDITERKERERALESLHEGTRAMVNAKTPAEVSELAVETASNALGLSLTGCWLYNPEELSLEPTAATEAGHELFSEFPTYTPGNSLSWEVFTTGEPAVYDDVGSQSGAYDPDSPIASEIIVPLGDHGVLNSGSTESREVDAFDVSAARILAANVEAALERAEREALVRDHETQLERERDLLAALFENVPDPIYRYDHENGAVIPQAVNPAFERVFGYEEGDVIGRPLTETIVPSGKTEEHEDLMATASTGDSLDAEAERHTATGRRTFLLRNAPVDKTDGAAGERTAGYAIYTDITERREAEQYRSRLYEIVSDAESTAEERVRDLLDLGRERLGLESSFLTRIENGTQRIVEAHGPHEGLQPGSECPLSQAYCRRTIETDEPVILRHAAEAGWADDPAYEAFGLETYVGSKLVIDSELYGTVCFADRTPREREFSAIELAFIDLLSRAVASELERRRYGRELERQNERLEEFASVLSHDLRNPLSVAKGYLEFLPTEDNEEFLARIENAHDRMERIIEDVLALTRQGETVVETRSVPLEDAARTAWEHVETRDARLETAADLGAIEADRDRLETVFENLFRNSVEHGSTGSRTQSGDSAKRGGSGARVEVGSLADRDGFFVADNGPGVPEAEREEVFEYGYTTSDSGTGLGLSIVGTVADAHGWTARVAESEHGGARFELSPAESG